MITHFQKMFTYNAWANNLFLQCLHSNTVSNPKILTLFSHILNAEEVWLCRLQLKPAPNQDIWKEYSLPTIKEKIDQQNYNWDIYLKSLEAADLTKVVNYQNSKGQHFATEINDILNHLVNHGTYHRAQVASLLKQEGIAPPVSDFIAFIRQK